MYTWIIFFWSRFLRISNCTPPLCFFLWSHYKSVYLDFLGFRIAHNCVFFSEATIKVYTWIVSACWSYIASQYTLPAYWGNYHLETKGQKKNNGDGGDGGGGVCVYVLGGGEIGGNLKGFPFIFRTKTQRKHEAGNKCRGPFFAKMFLGS